MKVKNDRVFFDDCDAHFVTRFGERAAADMVLDFRTVNALPFLYDTWQLADFLHIGRRNLFYYTKHADCAYRALEIPKHSGGVRRLDVPCKELRRFQNIIRRKILAKLPVSPYAMAYCRGRHIAQNAQPHVGKRYLLKLDITDFSAVSGSIRCIGRRFIRAIFPRRSAPC